MFKALGFRTRQGIALCLLLAAPVGFATAAGEPRYLNYSPPAGVGENAGEPTIGYNPVSHRGMIVAGLQTLRITYPQRIAPEGSVPEACDANWEDVSATITHVRSLDPILFTDQGTGRTFVSQLNSVSAGGAVLVPANSLMAYTDDDGASWTPAQVNPPDGSNDHQTVGSGPYPASVPLGNPAVNKGSAVYYCGQSGAVLVATSTALCSRSDDGGLNFGKATVLYAGAGVGCSGTPTQMIHGHVKVAPDGTVYVPNSTCGGRQVLVVSTDAGTTWTVRPVTGSISPAGILDPSVAIGKDPPVPPATSNTVYFCYTGRPSAGHADNRAFVQVSKDRGISWSAPVDVGASLGIKNAVFASAVAGDSTRAACAFLGTATSGDHQAASFKGTWHGYVAHTYDGGQSWTTVNATPNGPVQREACIWNGGGNNPCRNLLDFNGITQDEKGRVIFGYADGCIGDCETGGANTYSAKAAVAYQSGGKGLLAAFDTAEPLAPQRACLAGRRDDFASYLRWRAPDNGGSELSAYKIYRDTVPATGEVYLGQTGGGDRDFTDRNTDPLVNQYRYRIQAVNAVAAGAYSNVVDLVQTPRPESEGACALPGVQAIVDPAGDASDGQAAHDITSVSMAEVKDPDPNPSGKASKLAFTIKVANLATIPPGFRWAVRFGVQGKTPPTDATGGASEDYFISMVTSDNAAPAFTYGVTSVPQGAARVFTTKGNLDASSNAAADGSITLVIAKSLIQSPLPGVAITGMLASVRATVPSALPGTGGTNETIPDSTGGGAYTLRADNRCLSNNAPVARLLVSPETGTRPLIVQFDGSSSSDADSGVDTVASYTFNFGDGGDDVTQSSPTISHNYNDNGVYVARMVVNDSRGKLSANTAQAIIIVQSAAPEEFHFLERTGVATSAFITSEKVRLSGYSGKLPISVSNGGQYSIDGGSFLSAPGEISTGSLLTVRHISSGSENSETVSSVSVGSYHTDFKSVTGALDRKPEAFSFGSKTVQPPETMVESGVITLTGYNTAIPVMVGPGLSYRIDGGAWSTASGSLRPEQTLQVRHITTAAHLGYTKSYLKVGGVTGYFTTRTK